MRKLVLFVMLSAIAGLSCGDDESGEDVDASVQADADPNAPDADTASADADPAAPDAGPQNAGIECGGSVCDETTQECCLDPLGGSAEMCVDTGTCQTVTIGCDGPEDCPSMGGGQRTFCCARGGGGDTGGTECSMSNQCQFEACHTPDDCPQDAPECCDTGGLLPVNVCRPACFGPTP